MLQGLSRSTLNTIIIVCLLVISGIHLAVNNSASERLEALKLPVLNDMDWHLWPNTEGITVLLRAGGTTAGGTVAIRLPDGLHPFSLPAAAWTIPLHQQLNNISVSPAAAVILISGPWSETEQQAIAALIIRERNLQPLSPSFEQWPDCVQQHLPGALWLAQQVGLNWQTLTALPDTLNNMPALTLPDNEQWAEWRLQQSRILRRGWQDEQSQIDIQADLAYHRLPAGAYTSIYLALADAQKTDPDEALSCFTPHKQDSHE